MGFELLGHILALESGQNFSTLIDNDIKGAMNMTDTSITVPAGANVVIPDKTARQAWDKSHGWTQASHGAYSSSANLSRFLSLILRGISSSSNAMSVPEQVLQDWLTWQTSTVTNGAYLGLAWETYRPLVQSLNGGFPFSIHTKGGTVSPAYYSQIALVPEYGFGVVILTARGPDTAPKRLLDSLIRMTSSFVEKKRSEHARIRYAGTYRSVKETNSTASVLGLQLAEDGICLQAMRWNYKETNMLEKIRQIWASSTPEGSSSFISRRNSSNSSDVRVCFQPSGAPGEGDAWRAVINTPMLVEKQSIFDGGCEEWRGTDSMYYGNEPMDLIRFTNSSAGDVISVEIPWLRETLFS